MLTSRSSPVVGLTGQVALLGLLDVVVGVGAAGWVVGLACSGVLNASVARGLVRAGVPALGPADLVTLTRGVLACGVAALTADSFVRAPALGALLALAVVALLLDAVDGWVARRTRTASVFGARLDGEVDAFLILVLSVYAAPSAGWWVLAIGGVRYVFGASGWVLPWMRAELPYRYWRKVVTATQGVVLTFVAAELGPPVLRYAALAVAAALLAESFGRDVWWLWRRRDAEPAGRRTLRPVAAAAADVLAVLLVWFALVAPNQTALLSPGAFLRVPAEGLVLAGLALALSARPRRVVAAVVGVLLGLLTLVKVLDMGFFATLDRPFNAVTDSGYLGPAVDVVHDSVGPAGAAVAVVAAAALVVGVLVGMPLAVGRLARLVTRHRRWSLRGVTALAVVWVVSAVLGLHTGGGEPIATASAGRLAVDQVQTMTAEAQELEDFEAEAANDPVRTSSRERELLAGLRGKDVLVVFIESYGRIAVEGLPSSSEVRDVLDNGTSRLRVDGFSSRSAFLTSPTFGGLSWLAHSTLQSGLWVDDQRRYEELLTSDRMTLTRAFGLAGWRTVAVMPSLEERWSEGEDLYQFDEVHGRPQLGYDGPEFGWSRMPDQFVLSRFRQLELARSGGAPVMAKLDLTSSHTPWAPLPHLVGWDSLGDGSVFAPIARQGGSAQQIWRDPDAVRDAYVDSVVYCLSAIVSFVETYGDDDLVMVVLGDHQPVTVVSGHGASHDVPITIISRDRSVMDAIDGWGWQDGMRPGGPAPVWPMSDFRDRFLDAYSPLRP